MLYIIGLSNSVYTHPPPSQENERLAGMQFLDPGKRERKAIASYSETIARQVLNPPFIWAHVY
jgi:hypothetical protein